ncbi:MAG TPA: class I SAM-dependent methyltransferase [Rhodanobacteraceae bacterium]|nr:class I SAM-dependent methyltransferase [Rhodanobacteraceae bacterium]
MSDSEPSVLPFTGERFTPECVREIWYEHWHRYVFARRIAAGRRVLDAACGEGYGSALLADVAAEVVGVDIDAASIEHARERYGSVPNLRYEQGDATRLAFTDGRFDLVVCCETLEHVEAQERLIEGFARVLTDDGVLLVSSPDRRTYSEVAGFRNEFHVRELYRDELLALLRPHFPTVRLYGQKLLFQSAIWSLDADATGSETWTADRDGTLLVPKPDYAPLYFIALCARRELPETAALSLFGDRDESVYAHYNHEVRKNMDAGRRIAELEGELDRLRAQARSSDSSAQTRRPWWRPGRPEK